MNQEFKFNQMQRLSNYRIKIVLHTAKYYVQDIFDVCNSVPSFQHAQRKHPLAVIIILLGGLIVWILN